MDAYKIVIDAERKIDHNEISVGEYNDMIEPCRDVEAVVRCKECKYWQDNNGGYPTTECRWGHDETPDADDFCSYGQRKENE